ncbi:MAG: hypothetical protein ISR61_01190 [Desulfobacteraceae bacterium]|uniref:Uncharacterized protein n=1 Tax=Candidatus Desulfacyla euxinica TaxID=2841693 RepID=A0A8J6T5D3_9DELT|nr:hypothetical protein [Candidatus Desulfacyla euxinica]MBL6977530.1 hypothetical protein [Desulfobacteraceae bacterium]MBL7216159.1 hypothetical protein [Desulfobacteraceae bacterium]
MKIANPEIIRKSEQEFIKAIVSNLDWDVIREIFRKEHNLELGEAVKYKDAKINVYDNRIAFSLDFDVKVRLSIQLDREGNYISVEHPEIVDKSPKREDEYLRGEDLSEVDFGNPVDLDSEKQKTFAGEVEEPVEKGELIPDRYEEALKEIGSLDTH